MRASQALALGEGGEKEEKEDARWVTGMEGGVTLEHE